MPSLPNFGYLSLPIPSDPLPPAPSTRNPNTLLSTRFRPHDFKHRLIRNPPPSSSSHFHLSIFFLHRSLPSYIENSTHPSHRSPTHPPSVLRPNLLHHPSPSPTLTLTSRQPQPFTPLTNFAKHPPIDPLPSLYIQSRNSHEGRDRLLRSPRRSSRLPSRSHRCSPRRRSGAHLRFRCRSYVWSSVSLTFIFLTLRESRAEERNDHETDLVLPRFCFRSFVRSRGEPRVGRGGRGGGRGGRERGVDTGRRPKKSQEDLDAEMDVSRDCLPFLSLSSLFPFFLSSMSLLITTIFTRVRYSPSSPRRPPNRRSNGREFGGREGKGSRGFVVVCFCFSFHSLYHHATFFGGVQSIFPFLSLSLQQASTEKM